jgi:hypothetical protein
MTSYLLILFFYDIIITCRDIEDVRCQHIHVDDTSHLPAGVVRFCTGKKLIVQSIEVFVRLGGSQEVIVIFKSKVARFCRAIKIL